MKVGLTDLGSRMAEKREPKKWVPKKDFHPSGERGKLHRELGIPEGERIPQDRLAAAARSRNPEIRRDAIRAKTMEGWRHTGKQRERPGFSAKRLYGSRD